jgi:mevalonate kinase
MEFIYTPFYDKHSQTKGQPMHGQACGKTIFFGEHFVVHGLPGIVAGLDKYIEVNVEPAKHFQIIDNAPRFPGVPIITWEMAEKALLPFLKHLSIDKKLKITITGNLPIPHGGIGSSAALFVAITRALNKAFSLGLSEQEVCNAALEGDKIIHGNPSGIDNTAATFGGVFRFEKGQVTPIKLKQPIDIVLIDSGKKTKTKEVIEALQELKQRKSKYVAKIFDEYKKLEVPAHKAFLDYNIEKIGALMNKNHELLKKLTLSCDELENAIKIARDTGAIGAKLTGTGRGGLAIALTPGNQEVVASALEKAGYAALKTTIR